MNPRSLLITIGAAALGFALVLGVMVGGVPGAVAQTTATAGDETEETRDAARAQAYDDFLASLAGQLGVDAAQLDGAVQTALREQVDAQEAAGELSVEQAAALRAVIDVSEAPLSLGVGGRGRHGFDSPFDGPFDGRGGDEDRLDPDGLPETEDPDDETVPSTPVV